MACSRDEAALVTPRDGTWTASSESTSNTCSAQTTVEATLSMFFIDYDSGDSFQIERGNTPDIVCEIDGYDFVCPDYELTTFDIAGFAATLVWDLRIEGTFDSETRASGEERVEVSCVGEDCNLLDDVPCAQVRSFEITFAG